MKYSKWLRRAHIVLIAFLLLTPVLVGVGPVQASVGDLSPRPSSIAGVVETQPAVAWQEVWHAQGTLYAAALVPGHPEMLWAVGDAGRVLQTADGGRTWHFFRVIGRPDLHAVVLQSPYEAWVAGAAGTLLHTIDAGATWERLSPPEPGDVFTLDVVGDTLWLGGERGLFLSTDAGLSWTRVLSVSVQAWAHAGNLLAAGTETGDIYLSRDAGATWEMAHGGVGPLHDLAFVSEEVWTLYGAGEQGRLVRWPLDRLPTVQSVATEDVTLYALAVAPDGTLWVAGDGGRVYHVFGDRVQSFVADEDERPLYALFLPQEGVLWAVGEGPDVVRSEDGGQSWQLQNGGRLVRLRAVDFVNENEGWVVGERLRPPEHRNERNGIIMHTTDGGRTWSVQALPAAETFRLFEGIDCWDAQTCWVVGWDGRIFHTEDGGQTWVRQPSGTGTWLHDVAFASDTRGFVGGNTGLLLATSDGGATWTPLSLSTRLPLYDLDTLDEQHVAAALDKGDLLYTLSGGRYWARYHMPKTLYPNSRIKWVHLRGVDWTRSDRIWVTGTRGYLATFNPTTREPAYKEGGTKSFDWMAIEFTEDERWGFRAGGFCAHYDNEGACLAYTGGLIAVTSNWAESWTYYETGTPGTLQDIDVVDSTHVWAVGDEGVILRYRGEREMGFALHPEHTITPDGLTWDWTVIQPVIVDPEHVFALYGDVPTPIDDVRAAVSAWWKENALYLLVTVDDEDVTPDDALRLEFYRPMSDTLPLRVSLTPPLSAETASGQGNGYEWVSRRNDTGWQAEVVLSSRLWGDALVADMVIRWNAIVRDVDSDGQSTLVAYGTEPDAAPAGRWVLLGNTVELQRGHNAYTRTQDIWISNAWNEREHNWTDTQEHGRVLYVAAGDLRDALLWFDLSLLPREVILDRSTLKLYADARTGHGPLHVGVYPLRRRWVVDQVTGLEARAGEPWGKPGANDTQVDRWAEPVGEADATESMAWTSWDVTEAVRFWLAHPDENFGIILKSFQPGASPIFRFIGERHGVTEFEDKRPVLEIVYRVPTPAVTPTPTPTPTATWTPTPTMTPTPTLTPTPVPLRHIYIPWVSDSD